MGQGSSKTYYNPEMQQLKQLYSPTCKLSDLPGQPLCIQYASPLQKKFNFFTQCPLQPFLELYSLQLNASQQEIIKDSKIYDQRKHNLPWIVKVICYDVQKKHCQCSNFSYKYTVCTQRVQFRLNSFKIKGRDTNDINNSYKYIQSLSFEQAVYVLINTLQGLQILNQQFKINYPTAKSIGITRSGKVKVWINENWALNNQSSLVIPQKLIIQESLRLVAQRTKGNLLKMLAIENNYQNLQFHQIQAILSQFVIAFNKGKKMLVQRLNEVSGRLLDESARTRKYSLKKEKIGRNLAQNFYTPNKKKNQNQSTKREFYSNDSRNKKSNSISIQMANQNYPTQECASRNRTFSQPKKQIKFLYTKPQHSNIQIFQKSKQPIQIIFPQSVSNTQMPFRSQPLINPYIKIQQKNYSIPHFQRTIQRKISENTNTITTVNSNQQNKRQQLAVNKKTLHFARNNYICNKSILEISRYQNLNKRSIQQKQPFTAIDNNKTINFNTKNPKTVMFVTPDSILAQGQILVTQERSEEATPCKIESINSITEQFRQLLQSDKKIQSQSDFSVDKQLFEISMLSLQRSQKRIAQVDDNFLFYQKSESDIGMGRPFERNCYSIKEVDEELSYELQSNYNK